MPIQGANQAQPYHSLHILSKSSYPYPYISPLPPPHFYRLTPNHLHSYFPHVQTTSIYHTSPPQLRSEHPKRLYNTSLLFLSFRDTPHIHLTIILALQILSLHCPCLSPICQHTLDTSTKNHSFHHHHHHHQRLTSVAPTSHKREM